MGYRLFARAADCYDVETAGLTVPASSSYPLGRVPVTLPLHTDGISPKVYAIRKVFYPDTDELNELDGDNWRLAYKTLFLLNTVTDGASKAAIWAYETPALLVNTSDTPDLPEEFHEALVWAAMSVWLPGYATNSDLQERRAVYETLYKRMASELKRASDQTFAQRTAFSVPKRILSTT